MALRKSLPLGVVKVLLSYLLLNCVSYCSDHDVSDHHVLVTGGAGYIGSHACLYLLTKGIRVTAVDNMSYGAKSPAVRVLSKFSKFLFENIDLNDEVAVSSFVGLNNFTSVWHLEGAEFGHEPILHPPQNLQNSTKNPEILALALVKAARQITFLFSSTSNVYNATNLKITEQTPIFPKHPFALYKRTVEQHLETVASDIFRVVVFRYFNVVGVDPEGRLGGGPRSRLRASSQLWTSCSDVALGLRPHVEMHGNETRDYVHVWDLVESHYLAMAMLEKQTGSNEILPNYDVFNVGNGKPVTVAEFVEACREVTGHPIPTVVGRRRVGSPPFQCADSSKLSQTLKWKPRFASLTESLQTAWKYTWSTRRVAVLISGGLTRFLFKDSFVRGDLRAHFMNAKELPPIFDVHVALHSGPARAWTGRPSTPPYVLKLANVTENVSEFFYKQGAENVIITSFSQAQIDKAAETHEGNVIRHFRNEADKKNAQALIEKHRLRRWSPHLKMFFLRHSAYTSALRFEEENLGGFTYTHIFYLRDDNVFLAPLNLESLAQDLRNYGGVLVDKFCGFGSYSDKIYFATRSSADVLFSDNTLAFSEAMKLWVELSVKRSANKLERDPFQTETFLGFILKSHNVNVTKSNFHRLDGRYQRGKLCSPRIYSRCTDLKHNIPPC